MFYFGLEYVTMRMLIQRSLLDGRFHVLKWGWNLQQYPPPLGGEKEITSGSDKVQKVSRRFGNFTGPEFSSNLISVS